MGLLEYENQMFLDAFHEDGLLISARGLGLERIFTNFLKLYCDAGNLVLVLNTNTQEEEYFLETLQKDGVSPMPKTVTTDISINDRRDLYLQGGVLFITSRILVVDMLTERIPAELITGVLVYKAHKIIDSGQEAFILRLYRLKNKKGFVKAFSDSPLSFTAGFCHVERVMKSLFVRKLFLWPRFQASVISTMEKHPVDVVELYVQLTASMVACQTALLDLIDACVKELKRCNITLDSEEFTVENAMTRNFDKIVRLHLDPVWHQLGAKTKQLVTDIKTLRLVLEHLTQYDCVNFYNLVGSIRGSEKQFGSNSGWLFLDSADSLFVHAKDRVVKAPSNTKKHKNTAENKPKPVKQGDLVLEECPKWKALKDVLKEIDGENDRLSADSGKGRVLVVAQDDRTCNQLKNYLCDGAQPLLTRLYDKTLQLKSANREQESQAKGKNSWRSRGKQRTDPSTVTLTQMIDPDHSDEDNQNVQATADIKLSEELSDSYVGVITSPTVILHPLHGSFDPFSLQRVLSQVEPRFVVMYDADMQFVRMIEVFRANRPGIPLRVYFLMYEGSTEEQRYLTALRKEKEAFEYLIKAKATMVIPEEREGKAENNPDLSRDSTPANATTNTRRGGRDNKSRSQKIVVDMREFRSELPSLIHRRGIDIEPVTIEVGDYILTPEICVERKSVSDLIGSLNNGRLYNQCVSMCRFYKRPVLLIEFDPNKSFALQGKYQLRDEINSSDVVSRLALLTLHFPRLRMFWCQSPYATAELFEEVKATRAEPDPAKALAISGETEEDLLFAKYNHRPQTMLLKMPGINSKNVATIMNNVESMAELTTLPQDDLTKILTSAANARLLYNFLHKKYDPAVATSSVQSASAFNRGGIKGDAKTRKPMFFGKRKR